MNGLKEKKLDAIPRLKRFVCGHEGCAAAFSREWRCKEHESVHTGEVCLSMNKRGSRGFNCIVALNWLLSIFF